jgi:hypothetical protein
VAASVGGDVLRKDGDEVVDAAVDGVGGVGMECEVNAPIKREKGGHGEIDKMGRGLFYFERERHVRQRRHVGK